MQSSNVKELSAIIFSQVYCVPRHPCHRSSPRDSTALISINLESPVSKSNAPNIASGFRRNVSKVLRHVVIISRQSPASDCPQDIRPSLHHCSRLQISFPAPETRLPYFRCCCSANTMMSSSRDRAPSWRRDPALNCGQPSPSRSWMGWECVPRRRTLDRRWVVAVTGQRPGGASSWRGGS